MNDREFIELLNLYVDREITTADAVRLEAEVSSDPARRKIYDQYCRMQKACTMLAEESSAFSAPEAEILAFPRPRSWQPLQLLLAAAAAVCIIGIVGIRQRAPLAVRAAPPVVSASVSARPRPAISDFSPSSDGMRPVFLSRLPATAQGPAQLLSATDASTQIAQLNWIGDIHMAPVSPANADFLSDAKPELRASVLNDAPNPRDLQEPTELTAFRFQR